MMTNHPHPTRGAQRGASLIFALIVLALLSLAAVGLVRSVNTGTLIAGNLSFKRDATAGATAAAEQPIAWLLTQAQAGATVLDSDNVDAGYYASAMDGLDVTGNATSAARPMQIINWDGRCLGLDPSTYSSCTIVPFVGTSVNGNRVQWIITRLCDFALPMGPQPNGTTNLCTRPVTQFLTVAPDRNSLSLHNRIVPIISTPYYRIITRVEGARNTVSYVETVIHF